MKERFFKGSALEVTRTGPVATVTFMREQQRNALNAALLHELDDSIRLLRAAPDITVVILTGGERYFSAGADRKDPALFGEHDPQQRRLGLIARSDIARSWGELPQVTIAAIEGYAVGGALTIALSCDFRVMAEDAFIYVPEIDIGMPYGWSTLPRLAALAGPSVARRLVMLAERIPAPQVLEWKLADYLTAPGLSLARASELASQLAAKPALVLYMLKRSINALQNALSSLASHGEADQAVLCHLALSGDRHTAAQ
ncbi:enoyl-CoA hydratase/isomerase family protein [Verticiella sediminum]|nr:enoyl-CoA hydratase/isomerase family protein [Verticiella sediminum]